jgi:hypothetical protein
MRRVRLKRILGALAVVFVLAGLAFRLLIWTKLQQAGARTPRVDADMLLEAVRAWRFDHGPNACPSPVELRDAALVDLGEPLPTDPWKNQYVIECEAESVRILSPGPDRKANTPDDLVMH